MSLGDTLLQLLFRFIIIIIIISSSSSITVYSPLFWVMVGKVVHG